ncbi:MAG: transcription elongation factor GreA [Eubacteriales bacterium]|nr:transcription elongation factor GreA [Eubacteriales bacterium]
MSKKKDGGQQNVISAEGLKKLEEQLDYLINVRRPQIAEQIQIARGFGDLSENAEYDEAKNDQSKLEAQIQDLENSIRTAVVIEDKDIKTDRVNVGTSVVLFDEEFQEELELTIVGARESDPMNGRISNESPIGAALLGHKKNETVTVNAPGGTNKYKILKISRQ